MSTAQAMPEPVDPTAPVRRYVSGEVRAAVGRIGMTQRAVGRLLGISHTAVGRRWKGETSWDVDELIKLSVATNVPVGQFFPPLDFDLQGPLAQLVELRTFNPKSAGHLQLVASNLTPEPSISSAAPRLLEVPSSPVRLIRA